MSSVLVRAIDLHDDEEFPRFHAFQVEHATPRFSIEEARAFYPTLHAHVLLVAEDGDELVGGATAGLYLPGVDEPVMGNLFALPGRVDVLTALIDRIRAWTDAADAPKLQEFLSGPTEQSRADRIAAGMTFGNDRSRMRRALTDADRDLEVPSIEGVSHTSLAQRPDLIDQFLDVWNTSGADIPGTLDWQAITAEQLPQRLELDPGEPWPESVRITIEDATDTLVAFVALLSSPGSNGRCYGHRLTATRRDRRGRGLATAAKAEAVRWAARSGAEELVATNDSDNLAMRAINARLGFEEIFTIALYSIALRD